MKKTWIAWGLLLAACGGREPHWDAQLGEKTSYGLASSVALHDEALNRMLMVTSPAEHQLEVKALPIGQNVAVIQPSVDGRRLFVLSKGKQPRFRPEDERPQLTVISGGADPKLEREPYLLDDPLLKLAVDPLGEWVAAYQSDSTVVNPNQLVLFSLNQEGEPRSKTIRSFGGFPLELIFTDPLLLPSGKRHRFLVVRTDRDITLVDLKDLNRSEITVQLPQTEEGTATRPAQVVYDDGDKTDPMDARLAVRLEGQSDVVLLEFGPSSSDREFVITPNIVDVGGEPSSIDFVRTDGGLRLAALVPGRKRATLIDPRTTTIETVDFPVAYRSMTRITDSDESDWDVALLWSERTTGIAFWTLGQASGSPFRSVEANDIDLAVTSVIDVPEPNRHLKLLAGENDSRFFVLDLEKRQTFPMLTRNEGFRVNVSADGKRLWAFQPWSGQFSSVDLANLHPTSLSARLAVSEIHDISRGDGQRAALVLHGSEGRSGGDVFVTLLNANRPDSANTRFFSGLFLEGL